MNQKHDEIRYQSQIVSKLEKLMQITFNLKCITYQMANLSAETVKPKFIHPNSSILTTIDSIFFQLKRIETILSKQSDIIKSNSFKKSHELKTYFDSVHASPKNNLNGVEFSTFALEDQHFAKQKVHEKNNSQFQAIKNDFHVLQKKFIPKELSQYASDQDQYNQMCKTVLIKNQNNSRQFHGIGINKVSSYSYVGFSQKPIVKTQCHKLKGEQVNIRQNKSERGDRKSMIDINKFQLEQRQKESETEHFLRQISKIRKKILKNIQKKKIKCFNTINNINCSLMESKSQHESILIKKPKVKSKTEKFYPEEASNNYQISIGLIPSEEQV